MEKTNLENLNRLAKLFGTDRLISPEEIQQIFKGIVEILATYKKDTSSINEDTKSVVNKLLEDVISIHKESVDAVEEKKKELGNDFADKLTELKQMVTSIKEEMDKEDEMPEDDTDDEEEKQALIAEIMAQITLPEVKATIVSGEEIVDKINELPLDEDNKIDWARIKNAPKIGKQTISGSPTVLANAVDLDGSTRANGYSIVWDSARGRYTHSAGGSGSPGGSTTQLQYNNAGTFGGIAGATTDGTAVTYTANNLKAADITASSSAGLQILSNAGTVTSLHGAGGGANNTFYGGIKGDYLTASEMLITDDSKNIVSAPVATYPSLTELTYLKGVTSAIQTQLDAKVDENSAITGATKTKITYDAKGLVTGGADATTADIADTTNKRYVTDAQLTVIGNTSGTNTGDQTTITGNSGTATALQTARTIGTITGDATSAGSSFDGSANNTNALTLATVNSNVGSFGSATAAGTFTVNAKGLITAASSTTITPAVGSITGLGTGVGTALAVNVGTAGSPVVNGGALGTPSSGTVTNLTGTASININGTVGATTPTTGSFTTVTTSGNIELGNASDTTLSRSAAGQLAVEGVDVLTTSNTKTVTNKTLTTPTINGATITGDFKTDGLPDTDDTWTGKSTNSFNAGGTIAQFDCVYMTSSSTWALTDADAIGTGGNTLVMMAGEAGTNGNPLRVIEPGSWVRNDAWAWTVGGVLYLDTSTAGGLTQTVPSGTDDVVKIVGHAVSADVIYFNPSVNWIIRV